MLFARLLLVVLLVLRSLRSVRVQQRPFGLPYASRQVPAATTASASAAAAKRPAAVYSDAVATAASSTSQPAKPPAGVYVGAIIEGLKNNLVQRQGVRDRFSRPLSDSAWKLVHVSAQGQRTRNTSDPQHRQATGEAGSDDGKSKETAEDWDMLSSRQDSDVTDAKGKYVSCSLSVWVWGAALFVVLSVLGISVTQQLRRKRKRIDSITMARYHGDQLEQGSYWFRSPTTARTARPPGAHR